MAISQKRFEVQAWRHCLGLARIFQQIFGTASSPRRGLSTTYLPKNFPVPVHFSLLKCLPRREVDFYSLTRSNRPVELESDIPSTPETWKLEHLKGYGRP